jgi:hypothetical protein
MGRGKHLIHPPEFSGNSTSSHLIVQQDEKEKEIMNFAFEVSLLYSKGFFNMS